VYTGGGRSHITPGSVELNWVRSIQPLHVVRLNHRNNTFSQPPPLLFCLHIPTFPPVLLSFTHLAIPDTPPPALPLFSQLLSYMLLCLPPTVCATARHPRTSRPSGRASARGLVWG
jgi:hypothetical protein